MSELQVIRFGRPLGRTLGMICCCISKRTYCG